jgi:hypothetical protein
MLVFMKATIEFDDELYRKLKVAAALRGRKVRELVEEGVRMVLHSPPKTGKRQAKASLPLIKSSRKKTLDIPDDIVSRLEMADDLERYAASLRQ